MAQQGEYKDLLVTLADHVATVEIRRPPHNYFDHALIAQLSDAFDALSASADCRAIVLASEGKSFCAGANFATNPDIVNAPRKPGVVEKPLYKEAARLFRNRKPVIAAVHGPAVGGGLGLALMADFRVTCAEARFSANFARLGFHPGFGLTVTLPRVVGAQQAALLFFTGRRISGEEAVAIGLADVLVAQDKVREAALALAAEIAASAPLAVQSTRDTLRRGLADEVEAATERELSEQQWHMQTLDCQEGIAATAERRTPTFTGR